MNKCIGLAKWMTTHSKTYMSSIGYCSKGSPFFLAQIWETFHSLAHATTHHELFDIMLNTLEKSCLDYASVLLAQLTALSGISGCPLLEYINPIWFVISWCAANGSFEWNRSCEGILSVSQFSLQYQRRVEALTLHLTPHYARVVAYGGGGLKEQCSNQYHNYPISVVHLATNQVIW